MEGVCTAAGWLNHNYEKSHGPLSVANLFYISDKLPQPGEQWVDTMNNMELLVPFKQQVLQWSIRALMEE